MKMLFVTALISLMTVTALASENYSCSVPANPQNGFKKSFDLSMKPAALGGEMMMIQNGKEKSLGPINQVVVLNRGEQKLRFEVYLAAIGEPEVSGLDPEDLKTLTSIRFLRAKTRKGDYIVYQLMAGEIVIGGTLQVGDKFTACVP